MKVEYAIIVDVTYNGKGCKWSYNTYDQYPSESEIEKALQNYSKKIYPTDERPTVHYAQVEKRYKLN